MDNTIKKNFFKASDADWDNWQWQLSHRLQKADELKSFGSLAEDTLSTIGQVAEAYPFSMTPYYLSLANWDDPDDPIRRQVFPDPADSTLGARPQNVAAHARTSQGHPHRVPCTP